MALFEQQKQQGLETDIARLEKEVARQREMPEAKNLNDREIIKKSIQSVSGVPAPATAHQAQDDGSPLPSYAKDAPPAAKLEVERLLAVALREGVQKASEEASRSNPFVLDAFHDALTGKMLSEFQKRGPIK
jgi:hypothetical protein